MATNSSSATWWPKQELMHMPKGTKKYQKVWKCTRKYENVPRRTKKHKNFQKHCQMHNRPRVLSLKLELSLQLKGVQSQFSLKDNSSFRLNTLGPLCLWQCLTCQVASLALVLILATRWRYLNCLPMWPPDGTTCISCRFGQQLALLELVTSLVTKWCHLH